MQYVWLTWSFLLLVIWGLVYFSLKNKESRKEMLVASGWTSLLGLTEPIFVPRYWNPPSLFNLAQRTGFDLESLIFSFAIGGLAAIIYEKFFPVVHEQMKEKMEHLPRHRYHSLALVSAPLIFLFLEIFTKLDPIYSTFIALITGGFFTWYCRPDLKKKMTVSAFIFLGIYFLYFLSLTSIFPDYARQVWNLGAISGILILGIPLEELLFAFSLGFLWSSVYEHLTWRRLNGSS